MTRIEQSVRISCPELWSKLALPNDIKADIQAHSNLMVNQLNRWGSKLILSPVVQTDKKTTLRRRST